MNATPHNDDYFAIRLKLLEKAYPNAGDPRRDPDFGTRNADYEIRQLLGAILSQLYDLKRVEP